MTCVVPIDEGRVEISGYYRQRDDVRDTGRTFRTGALRPVVIHNWQE